MANEKNLLKGVATQFKSGEEAANSGRKGGIESGKSKRKKKSARQLTELMLNSVLKGDDKEMLQGDYEGLCDDEDVTVLSKMIAGQINACIKGNTKAFETLLTLMGDDFRGQEDKQQSIIDIIKDSIGE